MGAQDTARQFFHRIALNVVLLDLVMDHLLEPKSTDIPKGQVCGDELYAMLCARYRWSGKTHRCPVAKELAHLVKMLNFTIQVHPFILARAPLLIDPI